MKQRIRTYTKVGVAAAALCMAVNASADIIPRLESVSAEGSNYRWTWDPVELSFDERIENGDYFTFYDVEGFVGGSATRPEGWEFASSNSGKTPMTQVPLDDFGIANLTWTYTGEEAIVGPADQNYYLGKFSAATSLDTKTKGWSGAVGQDHAGLRGAGRGRAVNHSLQVAKQLELSEVGRLLNESLEEEKAADETLTKLASGGLFSKSVNKDAVS